MTLSEFFCTPHSPLQPLHLPWLSSYDQLFVKRDDLLHPIVSGNKWRKLRHAFDAQTKTVVSMGGAYSNHLHALAYLAKEMGWQAHGLIRGHAAQTATLLDCQRWGMQLHQVDRESFRQLRFDELAWQHWVDEPTAQWLPEGGKSAAAMRGVAELVHELPFVPDVVICGCGTGTTVAGIASALPSSSLVIGVVALKNGDFLRSDVAQLLQGYRAPAAIELIVDQHLGGYAKTTADLLRLIEEMEQNFALPLEPVYTAKVIHSLPTLAQRGLIQPTQRIVVVHSGGLQGRTRNAQA